MCISGVGGEDGDGDECGGECMHGRGIVCNDTGITGKLTSKLALRTALKSGPSGILLNCLHAHIVKQKCYARETCRFGNRTSMYATKNERTSISLKTIAILLPYVN